LIEVGVLEVSSLGSGLILELASGSAANKSIDHVQISVSSHGLHLNAMSVESSIMRAKEPRLSRPDRALSESFRRNC